MSPADSAPADLSDPDALGGAEAVSQFEELYNEAVEAGQTEVTVYGITVKSWESLYARFSERFPAIEIKPVVIFGPDLVTRVDTEIATGNQAGDMVSVTKSDGIPLLEKDQLEQYVPFTADELPDEWSHPSDTLFAPSTYIYTFCYNTDEVSEEEAPTSFDDLLDPRWQGSVGAIDLTVGPGDNWLTARYAAGTLEEGWANDFAAQDPVMLANENEVFTAVASGRISVGYYCWVRGPSVLQGQPVGFAVPMEGDDNLVDAFYRGVIKGAPNRLAAQLLESWTFTPEAQAMLAEENQQGLMPGAPAIPGLPPFDSIEVINTPDWDEYFDAQAWVRQWLDESNL